MWLNSHYIKEKPPEEVAGLLTPFLAERGITTAPPPDMLTKAVVTLQTRARTLIEMAEGAAFYFQDKLEYDPAAAKKFLTPELVPVFDALLDKLALVDAFKEEDLEELFRTMAESLGLKLGKIAQPVRVALCGKTASPGLFEVMSVLGRDHVLARLKAAREFALSSK
ncbi:MAG: hypothetical protein HQK58_13465 [Deltaproteobacteria bacterium]|nr:hypothetical protein [Deltaproteobacteria bacterium]